MSLNYPFAKYEPFFSHTWLLDIPQNIEVAHMIYCREMSHIYFKRVTWIVQQHVHNCNND